MQSRLLLVPHIRQSPDANRLRSFSGRSRISKIRNARRQRIEIQRIVSRQNRKHQPTIIRRARHRPQLIHRPRNRHRTVPAHASKTRPHPGNSAPRRRTNNRAARVRSDCPWRHRRSHNRARSARRSACPIFRVPGILARAGQRRVACGISQAAGQLDHRRFPDQHRSCAIQFFNHRRVVVERLLRQRPRSPRSRITFHRHKVFRRIRHAVQRSAIMPGGNFFFSRPRLLQRQVSSDCRKCVQLRPKRFAANQKTFRQLHGRNFPAANLVAELAHRKIENVFAQHGLIRPLTEPARTSPLNQERRFLTRYFSRRKVSRPSPADPHSAAQTPEWEPASFRCRPKSCADVSAAPPTNARRTSE